ncbi:MAG: helix-turn-helix domain-containing protein [Chloroflexi bacterium]|nr:helix-turn-helix domain-containing protein [Chloroflexota bacterium]
MSTPLADEYVTVAEAAALLKVSQSTIWRWINNNEIPSYRAGQRGIRLKRAELSRLIRPVLRNRKKAEHTIHQQPLELGPLTSDERKKMLAAVEAAKRLHADQLKRRSGIPFPSSADMLDELREERMRELP